MQIRSATILDAPTIAGFNLALAQETESILLDAATVERGVLKALEEDLGATYWVAHVHDVLIGQLMTTREWSDWHNSWYVWLQSVYVHPEHRGQGVFRSLLTHVLRNAAADGDVHSVRLYVEEENAAAKETYARLGFESTGYEVLHCRIENSHRNL